jgi:hypothetical protein
MNDNLIDELHKIANYFADAKSHGLEQTIIDTIHRLQSTERALDIYKRERERFRHSRPEITGEYFLAGGHGEKDDNQLPQFVRIVPAYGCAWEQVYEKTDRTISYEGS